MFGVINFKMIGALVVLILLLVPAVSFARDNTLTGGMSVGLDLDDRNYDDRDDDDDYKRIFLTPMLQLRSLSERDSFLLRASPSIKYDLDESDTDWDSNVNVAADRFMTKSWQMGISNHYFISDSSDTDTVTSSDPVDSVQEGASSTDPQLSSDRGRSRYWRNKLSMFSNYFYQEDGSFGIDFSYIALRNDDDTEFDDDDEEYDRYVTSLSNRHRFNAIWASTMSFRFVRGDFKSNNSTVNSTPAVDQLSDDLDEYYLTLGVENESIANNPISMSYSYTGAKYDETLQDDSDIHQMRLTWTRNISSRMYTRLGAGPSYEKTQGRDGSWGGNGVAELDYAVEYGSFNFQVEKIYDVDNFSGSDESGVTDSWITQLAVRRQLQSDLTLSGRLSYYYEDREEVLVTTGGSGVQSRIEEYHNDRYVAGATLRYTFLEFYNASIGYTFTKQDSDRARDDYDDHRLLLRLSWQKDLFHW